MKTMIARKRFFFAGRELKMGEEFRATQANARTLELIGHARPAPPPVAKSVDEGTRPGPHPDTAPEPRQKRSYRRRDMVAEAPRMMESDDGKEGDSGT